MHAQPHGLGFETRSRRYFSKNAIVATVAAKHNFFFSKNSFIFKKLYRALGVSEFDETGLIGFLATKPSYSYQLHLLIYLVVATIIYFVQILNI